jgi:2-polyprenyl-6-methoxyphenol hydroxylase-like FAD-dependent oxidoreductase
MPAAPHPTPGALLMGDAFNMRHPLTGGGMTVALSDIVVLQNLLKPLHNLHDASSLCKYLESFYTLRKVIDTLSKKTKNLEPQIFFFRKPLFYLVRPSAFWAFCEAPIQCAFLSDQIFLGLQK